MLFWATAEAFLYDSSKETPDESAVCLKERKARQERRDTKSSSGQLWPGEKGEGRSCHTVFVTMTTS